MSSAILYGAIVIIWAAVLIPRWLRRESSSEDAPEAAGPVAGPADRVADHAGEPATEPVASPATAPVPPGPPGPPGPEQAPLVRPVRQRHPDADRARVLGARRRLLWMLVALAVGASALSFLRLAAWWVILPPSVMLLGYLALLREAAKADAERLSARPARPAAPPQAARGATAEPARADGPAAEPDAQVIDITTHVGEEFYDQYADAKLRAVGD